MDIFLGYVSHYIKSTMNKWILSKDVQKNPEMVADTFTFIAFYEELYKYSEEPFEYFNKFLPIGLMSSLTKSMLKG